MRRLVVLTMVCLAVALAPATTHVQAGCQFVLGFADLRDAIGPDIVGDCLEDQRTVTSQERLQVSTQVAPVVVRPGTTVQRTTGG